MPKVFKYQVGDKVYISKIKGFMSYLLNYTCIIEELLEVSNYDYVVRLDDGYKLMLKEDELTKLNIHNFEIGQFVRFKSSDEVGQIVLIDEEHEQLELEYSDLTMGIVDFNQVEHYKYEGEVENMDKKNTYFESLGTKVGQLVDKKQQAYGDSVSKTYQLMQIFMENYDNGDDTYTIPKSLLKHILLQVRIIDKQNRIFSNPDGDLMQENPYMDTVGYGLLGTRMCEPDSK